MGKMSRQKGKSGELEVVHLLKDNGFPDARRGVQYQGGPDSPDVEGLPGYHIEVKRSERFNCYASIDQAADDAAYNTTPVVFHRINGRPWLAILDAKTFVALVKVLSP